jgi:hypothetical protein
MTTGDRVIQHIVTAGVAVGVLATTLDSTVAAGWQIIAVVWNGASYTIIGQKWVTLP